MNSYHENLVGVVMTHKVFSCYFYIKFLLITKFKFHVNIMSLKDVGPIIFGGTPGIISYLRHKGLLATSKTCGRYNEN